MRKIAHLTPRYILNRLSAFYYEKTHTGCPWLTPQANEILDSLLKKTDVLLEFGSGRSTIWFAKRVASVTSVEHDNYWHSRVEKELFDQNLQNATSFFVSTNPHLDEDEAFEERYVKFIDKFDDGSLDVCLVDGIHRAPCALKAIDKIKGGGVLVIDNVNLYLPSDSISPNSRSFLDGARGKTWPKVESKLSEWRKIWTSSGVHDTAFFFKP